MEKEEYQKMYDLEETFWWFKGKSFLIDSWMRQYYTAEQKETLSILDIGCGTGINMKMMEKWGVVHGIDASAESLQFCKKRGIKNLKIGFAEKIPFEDNTFDVLTCLDVLYHEQVKDDIKALKEFHRILKTGGRVIITDCAMKCLWSRHDSAFHAARRYEKEEMKRKLEEAGFIIEKISYFNTTLFLPVYISRKLNNIFGKSPKSDIEEINPILNKFLYSYYRFELSMLPYLNYPFGVSIFAVGRKR